MLRRLGELRVVRGHGPSKAAAARDGRRALGPLDRHGAELEDQLPGA